MSGEPKESIHKLALEASMSGDVTDLVSAFMEDAILMPPNDGTFFGAQEIGEWWKEYFKWFRIRKSVETEHDVTVAVDQAFQRSVVSVVVEPVKKGDLIQDEARVLTVWRRRSGGQWKISHMMWNSMKPVGSGTNRYISRIDQKNP